MIKEFYLGPLLFNALLVVSTISLGAQGVLIGHIDFTTYYSTEVNEWISEFRHGEWENPNSRTPTDEVSLHARDIPVNYYAQVPEEVEGDRYVQPPYPSYDFTGVPDGDPIWIIPRSDNGHSWPGFRNEQITGTFSSYVSNDSRVSLVAPGVAARWMTLEMVDMTYVGSSNNPQFSLWQSLSSGEVLQWMATSDGIDSDDIYYIKEGGHSHASIGFSSLGLYRIGYKPSAILEATGEFVVGSTKFVTFAIGTKAAWTATYYAGDDLFVGAVSGDESDSDMDGVELLLEYAFNLNPLSADFKILEPGNGTFGLPLVRLVLSGENSVLQIEYIRRKAETNPQISYFPEFASSLVGAEWTVQTAEIVTSIDADWERVVVTDSTDSSIENQRFGRVRVEMQEKISY